MELTTVQQILLIILAAALAIFLIVGIAISIMIFRLLKTLDQIAEKAEKVVESAEAVGDVFRRAAGPLGFLRFLQSILEAVSKHKTNKSKED